MSNRAEEEVQDWLGRDLDLPDYDPYSREGRSSDRYATLNGFAGFDTPSFAGFARNEAEIEEEPAATDLGGCRFHRASPKGGCKLCFALTGDHGYREAA